MCGKWRLGSSVSGIGSIGQIDCQPDGGSLSRRALQFQGSADGLGAAAHVAQSMPPAFHRRHGRLESPAIILNQNFQRIRGNLGLHVNLLRPGMPERIGQRLLDDEKDVVPHVRRQRFGRQIVRQVKPATGGIVLKQLIRKVRDVFDQALQRIAAGPHRPDDFLQRAHGLVGGLGKFAGVKGHLVRFVLVRLEQVAQQRNPRQ